jgi:hypothetical protein
MSVNKFESSDIILSDIFNLPFVENLRDIDKRRLNTMIQRFRLHLLMDVYNNQQNMNQILNQIAHQRVDESYINS